MERLLGNKQPIGLNPPQHHLGGTGIIDVLKDPKTLQAAMESKKATQLVGAGLTAGGNTCYVPRPL